MAEDKLTVKFLEEVLKLTDEQRVMLKEYIEQLLQEDEGGTE